MTRALSARIPDSAYISGNAYIPNAYISDGTVTLRGSYGDLVVDRDTGQVVRYDPCSNACVGPTGPEEAYFGVTRVDPASMIHPNIEEFGEADVLSVGWWSRYGDRSYSPPMFWRERGGKWDKSKPDSDEGNWHGDWFDTP